MVFGRKKGFLPSWTSTKNAKEIDPQMTAKDQQLDVLQKTVLELQSNMRLYLTSWTTMCQASTALAEGLARLANDDRGDKAGTSPLKEMARMYHAAHHTIDGFVREPTQRVAEVTTLRETGSLLSRFPPIYRKIERRRQLLADVELAESKVRVAEAAKDRERDSFAIVAGNEHRRRMSAALVTVSSVARGVTEEIMADVDRLEEEKGSMLVPQVSALVGCQAYFMRRSATVLERLASKLPYSALALCRLVRPSAMECATASPVAATDTKSSGGDNRAIPFDSPSDANPETGRNKAALRPLTSPPVTSSASHMDAVEASSGSHRPISPMPAAVTPSLPSPPPPRLAPDDASLVHGGGLQGGDELGRGSPLLLPSQPRDGDEDGAAAVVLGSDYADEEVEEVVW